MWLSHIFLDYCTVFGMSSALGIFGQVADIVVQIFKYHDTQDVLKWVNDFVFWCYLSFCSSDSTYSYSYDEFLIFSVTNMLG